VDEVRWQGWRGRPGWQGREERPRRQGCAAAEIGVDLVQQAVELLVERGRLAPGTIPAIIV
jgi:hypothetical protein